MTQGTVARYGYWVLVGVLAVAIGSMTGLIIFNLAHPELERALVIAAEGTPSPAIDASASPSGPAVVDMGGAVIPGNAQCAGCHTTTVGTIGLRSIPVMGHALEGWGKCAGCHAPARLVDTAPGHTGIHASECTVCHKPGDLPAPLSRPHRENQNVACLTCHGIKAPLPVDMTHRKEAVCWLCHRLPTIEPPVPAHQTAPGEADCLTCHVAGGKAGGLPTDHVKRPARLCLSCHEITLGVAPGGSPGIKIWPAPSTTPEPG